MSESIATVLALHNHPVYGQFTGPSIGYGAHVKCSCGWIGRINYRDMNDDDHDSAPYLDRLLAEHQYESLTASGVLWR